MPSDIGQQQAAIVTGGSGGVGRAIAERLAKDGHPVVLSFAGNPDAANETVRAIEEAGGQAMAIRADVAQPDDVTRLYDEAEAAYGVISIIATNTGQTLGKSIFECSEAEYDSVINTNMKGVFLVMAEASRRLADGGRIINTSASFEGPPAAGDCVSAASQMAIEKLTEGAARELHARGITVNAVRPASVDTIPLRVGAGDEAINANTSAAAPAIIGQTDDVLTIVSFLAGPDGDWVTGQTIGAIGTNW